MVSVATGFPGSGRVRLKTQLKIDLIKDITDYHTGKEAQLSINFLRVSVTILLTLFRSLYQPQVVWAEALQQVIGYQ